MCIVGSSFIPGHHLWFIIMALEVMFDKCVFTQPRDSSLYAYIYSMYLDKIET